MCAGGKNQRSPDESRDRQGGNVRSDGGCSDAVCVCDSDGMCRAYRGVGGAIGSSFGSDSHDSGGRDSSIGAKRIRSVAMAISSLVLKLVVVLAVTSCAQAVCDGSGVCHCIAQCLFDSAVCSCGCAVIWRQTPMLAGGAATQAPCSLSHHCTSERHRGPVAVLSVVLPTCGGIVPAYCLYITDNEVVGGTGTCCSECCRLWGGVGLLAGLGEGQGTTAPVLPSLRHRR